ncbi:hypothetical protein BRARA_E00628 [Brassica rapa]|uniref:Uncharacterized protein n=1 Tax=Brassica campestris TaxID=3711 RepID=A0A397Z754_BRACM|nr:hypothetical protein BRARA_E00628 [Brassica rapa]
MILLLITTGIPKGTSKQECTLVGESYSAPLYVCSRGESSAESEEFCNYYCTREDSLWRGQCDPPTDPDETEKVCNCYKCVDV